MCGYANSGYPSRDLSNSRVCEPPICFMSGFNSFIDSLKYRELREHTIYKYRKDCINILNALAERGASQWDDINFQMVADAFKHSTDKPSFRGTGQLLFAHLVKQGLLKTNFSVVLPKPRIPQRVPSVYSKEEIDKILNAIDKRTAAGKRDYAIILLALRLGLRNSDIRNLKFENVNFESSYIAFTQFKTQVAHKLKMPDDVKKALKDYINNARAQSNEPYIFLCIRKPYVPLHGSSVSSFVRKRIEKAGIHPNGRHLGPHALRSTFASELLSEKVPYDTIRVLLGHTNPNNVRCYTKMSIEDLRTCALEVSPPSGLFAKYLAGEQI